MQLHRYLPGIAAVYLLLVVLPLLPVYGLWFDEIFSVVMSRDIDSIVQMVRTQENNMLLHYLLLYLWQPLAGSSEFLLRLSSVLLVLLALWSLYAGASRLGGSVVAACACCLFVSHFLVLEHARSCRGYSLALLMSALLFWRWVVAWQTSHWRDWLLVGALAGVGVWAHYFSVLVPPVLVFAMLWRDGLRQPWRPLLAAMLMFVLCALPIALTRPPDGAAQIAWAEVPSWRVVQGTLWMLAGADGLREQHVLVLVFFACAVAMLAKLHGNALNWRSEATGLGVGLLLIVWAVLLESFFGQPVFVYRFFTPLVPIFCFVMGVALSLLWPWLRYVLLVCVLVLSAVETLLPVYREAVPVRYWWKPAAQQLLHDMRPGDVLLVYPSFLRMPVDYYLDVLDPQHALPRPVEYVSSPYRQGGGVEPAPDWQRLQQLSASGARIWLLADEKPINSWVRLQRTEAPAIRRQLRNDHQLKQQIRHATISLERYDRVE